MLHIRWALVGCVSLISNFSPAAGATASLVADINPGGPLDFRATLANPLVPLGDRVLAFDHREEVTLLVSDGTPQGTGPVREICSGSDCGPFEWIGTVQSRIGLFTVGRRDIGNWQLWRSDGTRQGTFSLSPTEEVSCSPQGGDTASNGREVFFPHYDTATGCELWRTDGTPGGTRLVWLVGSRMRNFLWSGDHLFFVSDTNTGSDLWISDGTATGTSLVRTFAGASVFDVRPLTTIGSRLLFTAPGDGLEVWSSDGTPSGTRSVSHFSLPNPFVEPQQVLMFGGFAYFLANEGGINLWRSDGTEAGTRQVTAFVNPAPFPSLLNASSLAGVGDRIVFLADDGSGVRLWTSRGSPKTTVLLAGCPGGCPTVSLETSLATLGNRVVFGARTADFGVGLWSTDGTGNGTGLVKTLCSSGCRYFPAGFAGFADGLVFVVDNFPSSALWKTDGTPGGTVQLATLGAFSGQPGTPWLQPTIVGPSFFFIAAAADRPDQLWRSDGSPERTGLVTVTGRSAGSNPTQFADLGPRVIFQACDGDRLRLWATEKGSLGAVPVIATAPFCSEAAALPRVPFFASGGLAFFFLRDLAIDGLWRTDGTASGTFKVTPDDTVISGGPVPFSSGVVFLAKGSLWTSDGTVAGTRQVFTLPATASIFAFGAAGSRIYVLQEGVLWVSDATAAGTRSITLPAGVSLQFPPVAAGGLTFFVANQGQNLWVTDGTTAGSHLVLAGGPAGTRPTSLAEFRGALYYMGRTGDGRSGLWRSDGTSPGTVLLKAFAPVGNFAEPAPALFTTVGSQLFFVTDDGEHGLELWRTDGTAGGTALVRDIVPGSVSGRPSSLAAGGDRLFFAADDGEHGSELWESDGTPEGTRMVQDLAPGAVSSDPSELAVIGESLYFAADDGLSGREPWVYPLSGPTACVPSEKVLCLQRGRFRVEASWHDFAGHSGQGHAVALTADTGYFWFFSASNVEVILKVLDGRSLNDHQWVFYGALSNVEYTLTVTDTQTGAARRYVNPPGLVASVGDVKAFGPLGATGSNLTLGPEGVATEPLVTTGRTAKAGGCVSGPARLCLNGGRFAVEARWHDFAGNTGAGTAVPLSGDTGYFWFFGPSNVEVVLKVLDGRPVNGRFWVFYGALSNVEYTLTVTDTQTGVVKTYTNPSGRLASLADTGAF